MSGRAWTVRFLRVFRRRYRLLLVTAILQLLGYTLLVAALAAAWCGADYWSRFMVLIGAALVGAAFVLGWIEQGCKI